MNFKNKLDTISLGICTFKYVIILNIRVKVISVCVHK